MKIVAVFGTVNLARRITVQVGRLVVQGTWMVVHNCLARVMGWTGWYIVVRWG